MPRAGFEHATPTTKRPQTALDHAATLIAQQNVYDLYSRVLLFLWL
jgi:hypothetical protein